MKFAKLALFAIASSIWLAPFGVFAQQACEAYRVKEGDTLRAIAKAAYGYDNYKAVWSENLREIGRNPNVISVGSVLRLPCLPNLQPKETAVQVDVGRPISFVTANGYLPYTDESLANQGLITHLITIAMERGAPSRPIEIIFIDDRPAQLEELLPRKAFDASFPWTRPPCDGERTLTPSEVHACQYLVYSNPFYEIVEGFFSRTGNGLETIIEFDGLKGATLCRPEGYSTAHLEENDLMPPGIELVQPKSVRACFDMLMTNEVDLVSLDTRAGEHVIMELNLSTQVSENPHLFSIQPIQVALHRDNPKAEALIEDLNRGLAVMLDSGEWAAIVREGLRGTLVSELVN